MIDDIRTAHKQKIMQEKHDLATAKSHRRIAGLNSYIGRLKKELAEYD